jgi:hypothetical protein
VIGPGGQPMRDNNVKDVCEAGTSST